MAKRKPGKYDHLFPKLKKLPPQDLDHQLRIEEVKKTLRRCAVCEGTGKTFKVDEPSDQKYFPDNAPPCVYCDGTGRRKLTGKALSELYIVARADKETLEQMTKDANLELEAVTQLLIASQEAGDSDWGAYGASDRGLKLTNGDAIRVQPEVFALPRKKADFREWCYNHGLRDQMELPDKPTIDLVKLRLLNGESEPDGVEVYVRTRVVYTPMKMEVQPSHDDTTRNNTDTTADIF